MRSRCRPSSRRARRRPIVILADVDRLADRRRERPDDRRLRRAVDAVDGVDRVEGPFARLTDPQTGAPTDARAGAPRSTPLPRDQLPARARAPPRPLEDLRPRVDTVRLDAISPLPPSARPAPPSSRPSGGLAGDGVTAQVGGARRQRLRLHVSARPAAIPYAIGLTLLASGVILFLLFGSVVIPIKAVHA